MRRSAEICFHGKKEILNEIYAKISMYSEKINITADMLTVEIYEDTQGYVLLMDELTKRDIKYTFAEGREYTKEELKAAKFFSMEIIYPWESDGTTAEKFGTRYENTCQRCGIGKKQISDLIIDTKKAVKYDISTIQPEIIVNERLYNLINENGLTGCSFKTIKDFRERNDIVLYQLIVTSILPPMNEAIRVETVDGFKCEECKRNGEILRSEAIYEGGSLQKASDFNLTYEYFGLNLYCSRHVIVSSKVYNIFNKNKIKRVAFEPVRII